MFGWLKLLWHRPTTVRKDASLEDAKLSWEAERRTLQLELEEQRQRLTTLTRDLEQLRGRATSDVQGQVNSLVVQLMTEASGPIAQLLLQAHAVEKQEQPVAARDVLVIAKRLIRVFENAGLTREGNVGDEEKFDPNRHQPIGDGELQKDDPVVIRFVGLSYASQLLRRASVERKKD